MWMVSRENSRLVDAIATTEGKQIVDGAHELIRFEYQAEGKAETETWDLDVSQKLEIAMGEDACYYVPAYRVTHSEEGEEEKELMRVLLFDEGNEIATGKSIFKRATVPPRKSNLTKEVWKENKAEIRKRRGVIGGAAVGSTAVLGAGVVVGVVGIKKWVEKRR